MANCDIACLKINLVLFSRYLGGITFKAGLRQRMRLILV